MQEALVQAQARQRYWLWKRSNRVITLVGVVVILSVADLYMTMMHLATIGMLEGNPLARWIMRNLDPVALVLWKSVTLLVAGAILVKIRHTRHGEFAAWICTAILVWLMFRWYGYSSSLSMLTVEEIRLVTETGASQWVMPGPAS